MTHQRSRRPGWLARQRQVGIAVATVVAIAVVGGTAAYAITDSRTEPGAAASTMPTTSQMTATSQMTMPTRTGRPGDHRPRSAIFTDTCALARTANDDPILYPGQAGVAMLHNFFGNTAVTAGATAATLTGGPSNCSTSADASSYWTPVLYRDGQALTPSRILLY